MKHIKFSFLVCIPLLLASCDDWLDVTPRSQVKAETLYGTEDGFKQALNGAYIQMGDGSLYGRNASMYVPEFMAKSWTVPSMASNLTNYSIANLDFTESGAETVMSNLFSAYYKTISQLNDILANLQTTTVQFNYSNDKLIEGEALGLRAFLHLDVLRLWGPTPVKAEEGTRAVPYVTAVTNNIAELRSKTWGEVKSAIIADLDKAEELLGTVDPITYANKDSLNSLTHYSYYIGKGTMPKDEWQMKRRDRFNYYAVLATKARFYHYIGDKENAARYAKMVVDAGKTALCTESTVTQSLTMYPEQIFGLSNVNLLDLIRGSYLTSTAPFTVREVYLKYIYETTLNVNDIRAVANRYWGNITYLNGTVVNTFYKFVGNDKVDSDKRIPMLRLSEMYLIMTEDLPMDEAKGYFTTYRISRGMTASVDDTSFASESALLNRLTYEYLKEFYGEGQMYYFYKSHNTQQFAYPSRAKLPATGYDIPLPQGLTNFE
ncbi:MAG: RagB/SusD family nutrient uptake outer membrane protein [Prevotella sp.]